MAPGGRLVAAAAGAEPRARVPSLSSFASTILLPRIPMPGLARPQDTPAGTLQQAELLEPRGPQHLGSRLQISLPQPHRAVAPTPRPLTLPQLPPEPPALPALHHPLTPTTSPPPPPHPLPTDGSWASGKALQSKPHPQVSRKNMRISTSILL